MIDDLKSVAKSKQPTRSGSERVRSHSRNNSAGVHGGAGVGAGGVGEMRRWIDPREIMGISAP